jgi:predicted TIM-barrel fold metal-dependent hydrolase
LIVDAHQHFRDSELAAYPRMTDAVAPIRRRSCSAAVLEATAVAAYGLRSTNARSST